MGGEKSRESGRKMGGEKRVVERDGWREENSREMGGESSREIDAVERAVERCVERSE